MRHNHLTRDIKPEGQCPACDESRWVRSSLCQGGECVEISGLGTDEIRMRSSANRSKALKFTPQEWDAFLGGVRNGEFDLPA